MTDHNFFERVYVVVRLIPIGRVTSFGAIAAYLGTKGSSRMVGYALQVSDKAWPPVPAHRVVNRQGLLTGKFHFGSNLMEELLESEGIKIQSDQVQDFKAIFWDPAIEFSLEKPDITN
ncbi:MGMT family protein [Mucilaginibacter flavidus]|uniref:MGMT family protein n=1 Tax=Mucilaginibacter flavidus TaxID=2949309 RepID=UPI00209232CC|nr:MGMT family protein [Mucilaginibacter flavidus]MCO5948578.1 MGMT family protein [Mucilaginibacter flavidus]